MLTRNGEGCFKMRIVAKPRFKRPKGRWLSGGNACAQCVMLEECKSCAADGRVLACEQADELDGMGTRCQ